MKLRTAFGILILIAMAASLSGSEAEGRRAIGALINLGVDAFINVVMGFVDYINSDGGVSAPSGGAPTPTPTPSPKS